MNERETYCEKFYQAIGAESDKKEIAEQFLLDNLCGYVNSNCDKCYAFSKVKSTKKLTTMEAWAAYYHIDKEITKNWYQILKDQFNLPHMRSMGTDKRINPESFGSADAFFKWYIHQPLRCCYCGVKETDLPRYFDEKKDQYKEARQRGKLLEVERLVTAPNTANRYNENNCALACYICNNAKSDFISPKDFKPIAKGIYAFWQCVLKNDVSDEEFESNWNMLEKRLDKLKKENKIISSIN